MQSNTKTVRVLAAPGKFVIPTGVGGGVKRRAIPTDDGGRGSVAVYICDSGLYDARLRSVFVPGPVEVPDDARTAKLLADGDLVLASAPSSTPAAARKRPAADPE